MPIKIPDNLPAARTLQEEGVDIIAEHDAINPDAAAAFVEFVTGAEGQRILASFGFGAP